MMRNIVSVCDKVVVRGWENELYLGIAGNVTVATVCLVRGNSSGNQCERKKGEQSLGEHRVRYRLLKEIEQSQYGTTVGRGQVRA